MGENRWRFEHEWPLTRTEFTRYFLHSHGHANSVFGDGWLSPEAPGGEPPDRYDYDPDNPVPTLGGNNSTWTWMKFAQEPIYPGPVDQRPLERRDDVLVYSSPVLSADLEVTGPLAAVVYAESSALDTDFTAKLVDVYPDGRAIHLAEGILRARHRASAGTRRDAQPPVGEKGGAGRGAEMARGVGQQRRERVVAHVDARYTGDRLAEHAPHTRVAQRPAENVGDGGQRQARRPVTVWWTMCAIVSTMASRLTPRPSNSK